MPAALLEIPQAALQDLSTLQVALLCFLATAVAAFLLAQAVFRPVDKCRRLGGRAWKLPPGPRGWPIFGNMWELQRASPEDVLEYRKYGEMMTTHLGSKTWVILNSCRVANEIYNRHGAATNERPHLPVISGLISHNKRSVWLPTVQWTERRRVLHQLLSGSAMAKYAEYQELESAQLLAEYLYEPEKWYVHNGRYSNSVIHRIALGERISGASEKLASIYRVVVEFVTQGPPMSTIDCFPALSKLPTFLQWWRKRAEVLGQSTYDVYIEYWTPIRDAIRKGNASPCFARDVLVGEDAKFSGDDEDAMYLTMQLIEAGSDTTRASLNIFAMAAVAYPDVIQKARAEVDRVCGSNAERLPVFTDELMMPYVNALIKELLRWRPIFQWTPEHVLTEDLEFEDYSFPKGTSFVLNHSALSLDPAEFEDPDVLRPERWLNGYERDVLKGLWSFGGGRRVCVGYRLAQKSLFINFARLLYCYDFKAVGPIDDTKLNHYSPSEPFPVLPKPRSSKHEKLIIESAETLGVLECAQTKH